MTTSLFSANSNQKGWRRFFTRRPLPQPGPIILNQQQIFVLPTKAGLGFVLALLIMLLGSMNYNNSMGYVLTFLLGSMAIVSILHTHRTLLGLRIEAGKVDPVFAGETAQFQLWLNNHGQAARYSLIWQPDFASKNSTLKIITDVLANQRQNLLFPIPTQQRGRIFLGKMTVYTRFPLGIFRAWANVHLDVSTLVYPQPRGHKTLPRGQQADNLGEGTPCDGGGEDFMGYRDYQPGDSPRHIDWKAVAREQDWMIKQFGGMSAATVWFTWAEVSTLNDLEAGLSQLCLWILVAEHQGAQYGLKIPGCTIEPNSGDQHREHCLSTLALYGLPSNSKKW